jgi:hypothetical protein
VTDDNPGPGERFGEGVVAVVSLRPGASAGTDALREHCRMTLAGYMVPVKIEFVTEVMRSPVGKAYYRWARAAPAGPEPAPFPGHRDPSRPPSSASSCRAPAAVSAVRPHAGSIR